MTQNIISSDECLQIIRSSMGDGVEVIDHQLRNYSDGYPGFLGDYFNLQIKFRDAKGNVREKSFFVKSLPLNNIEKRKMIEKYKIFQKEARFYRNFQPKLLKFSGNSKWSSRCFLSRDEVIVLDDLSSEGYRTLPRHLELSIDHIMSALRSLAAFQAANIIYERIELQPKGRTIQDEHPDVMFETSYTIDNAWFMTGVRTLKAVALCSKKYGIGTSYEEKIQEKFIEKVCEIFDLIENPPLTRSSIPWVCCHRDLWRNNLMYRFERDNLSLPLECLLIDFQICRYLPLPIDVIICILLPSEDHSILDECLKFYYNQLEKELKLWNIEIEDIMSFDQFDENCKLFTLYPLVQQAIFCSLTSLPEDFLTNLIRTDEKKYMRMCNENRDEVSMEMMENDEFYRTTMLATVERLIEFLFNSSKVEN